MSEHDEVVEAMARGYYEAIGYGQPWATLTPHLRNSYIAPMRAAIRALPPGWVVAKVPDERIRPDSVPWRYGDAWEGVQEDADPECLDDICNGYADGWNAALAAVRASAVEVG